MTKNKRCVFYLPKRLINVLEDIMPLFIDSGGTDPFRGAMTRALEHIIQEYMASEDYLEKADAVRRLRWHTIIYMSDKEKERVEGFSLPKS